MLKLGTYEAWFDGETIVPGETLEERLANLEEWGYQGIQLHRRTAQLGVRVLKEALAGSSVQLCIYGGGGIDGCDDVSEMPNITIELLRRGYSKEDIEKIWGANFMRVFREVERIANSTPATEAQRAQRNIKMEN